MEEVDRVRPRRRPGAGDLQRLSGPVRGRPAARGAAAERLAAVRLPPGRTGGRPHRQRLHARVRRRAALSIPVKHTTGRYYAPDDELDRLESDRPGRAALRAGREPNGSLRDIAGVCNERGNVFGLMPHPEHAVDPLTGSADGLKIFESMQNAVSPTESPSCESTARSGSPDHEYELIVRAARPRAERRRAGDAVADVVRALRLQALASKLLRRLPTEGPHVLMGPGENAGAVDVGDGLAVAFKVESHNHPSAVEPFQGAATGVGGILRDVFAVGARPIAVLDSLRFGEPATRQRSRYLLERRRRRDRPLRQLDRRPDGRRRDLLRGASYEQNCLINAMCLGLAPHERLIRSAAAGPGNVLVLLGALTGRDGIGGASVLASAELGEGDEAKRPIGSDRRPVRGEEAARVLPRAARPRAARLAPGPRRRRADLVGVGDGEQGRASGSTSTSSRVPLREAGHGAVRDHGLRVPGADAVRGRARARRRGDRGVRAVGGAGDADRRGHRLAGACACSTRRRAASATCRSTRSSTTARCTTSSPVRAPDDAPVYARRRTPY